LSSNQRHDLPASPNIAARSAPRDTAEPLSTRLKRRTAQAHRRAERSGVIHQLVTRQATRDAYICYLRNLYPVYTALESGLSGLRGLAGYRVLTDPALERAAAIEADLRALAGTNWQTAIPLLASAKDYAQRIEQASTSRLLAHAYVRYLGDLNGGQIIRRLLRDSLALGDTQLGFYEFPEIDDIESFREGFKADLDALAARLDAEAVVDEALRAFALATRVSVDIEAHQA
jgi:heme oxygenase